MNEKWALIKGGGVSGGGALWEVLVQVQGSYWDQYGTDAGAGSGLTGTSTGPILAPVTPGSEAAADRDRVRGRAPRRASISPAPRGAPPPPAGGAPLGPSARSSRDLWAPIGDMHPYRLWT